jgi:hypothetical protein
MLQISTNVTVSAENRKTKQVFDTSRFITISMFAIKLHKHNLNMISDGVKYEHPLRSRAQNFTAFV